MMDRVIREMTRDARTIGQSRAARARGAARNALGLLVHDVVRDTLDGPPEPAPLGRTLASMRDATRALNAAARSLAG